jgi:sulfoxide reductase heme-binding subunit YedZ
MKPWHFRLARGLIYFGALVAAVAVGVSARWGESDLGQVLVAGRQLYGLWALGLLVASMLLGPLTSVLPWMPFKVSLMYGRRAVGVSALMFAILHIAVYIWSVLRRNWQELYTPGVLWVAGLIVGMLAFSDMIALAVTSRDASVKKMGGRKWKRLHRTVYVVLGLVLLHALFVGADFGLNRGPDVKGEADFGSLIVFTSISVAWFVLVLLRRRGWRWTPKFLMAKSPS